MHKKARKTSARRRGRAQKGSALLVSLMVMVGLSLLGLTFVAVSETENAISINERNKTQTSALAEAGAKVVVQWFQNPANMLARGVLPTNDDDFKNPRVVNAYSGYYKPINGSDRLCDTPFGPEQRDMFFGNEENADVMIVRGRNPDSDTFLGNFNSRLFFNSEGGEIVDIRIYAPPNVGGVNVGGFWIAGQRYGVATVAVTAEKRNPRGTVIARSTCRLVLAPFPLPGPTGAVQPIGGFTSNGAYDVHWGSIESESTGETYVKREASSFPWFDPYDRAYIEYGYDSSRVWTANREYFPGTYPHGETVRPSDAAIAARPELKFHEYTAVEVRADRLTHPTTEPAWPATANATFWDNNVRWQERAPTVHQIGKGIGRTAAYYSRAWLYEMLRRPVQDPWFQVRVRGFIEGKDSGDHSAKGALVYDYATQVHATIATAGNFSPTHPTAPTYSHYMQRQTFNNKYLFKVVDIPSFDYEFWKAAAQAGRGEPGVFYLRHLGEAQFTDEINTRDFEEWIAAEEGFLFFDSNENHNPQTLTGAAKEAALVDEVVDPCGARGMIYGNFTEFKTTGCNDDDGWYRMPGEPYRDIGYRRVNLESAGTQVQRQFTTDAAGNYVTEGAYDNKWSYQDLPWSNGSVSAEGNGVFDVCVAQRTFRRESTNSQMTEFLPLPYYPNCTPGNNITTPGCNCSEPHEPYLNIHYDGTHATVQAYWDNPTAASSVYPKETDTDDPFGNLVACDTSAVTTKVGQEEQCATNAYDKLGALARIAGNQAPGVIGVLYNEGRYNSSGNGSYYGSIVTGGVADPSGTQEVWFDECLVKGCWPPAGIPFPRVMITSTQIE